MNRHYNPSQEHLAAPRAGTLCRLVERTVVVEAGDAGPAVHALRFALPRDFGGPPACCGGERGIVHVHVQAPEGAVSAESNRTDAADGARLRPYSAELEGDAFTIHVKVYPCVEIKSSTRLQCAYMRPFRRNLFGCASRTR